MAARSITTQARPFWQTIAPRFSDEKDCLAAFLALETAEVLSRVKPANLLNIANRNRSCGRNLYRLWRQHGRALIEAAGLGVRELFDRGDSLLLLIFDDQSLGTLIEQKKVAAILSRAGYRHPRHLSAALDELQSRLQRGEFPHEIGVFLGYPLKDVLGFMGIAKVPFTCQGPWKIYGDPAASLQLADACRQCRHTMAMRLENCAEPLQCLRQHHPLLEATRSTAILKKPCMVPTP